MIVNLQGDLPVFKKDLIEKTVGLFADKKTEIASAVCDLESFEINDKNIVKANVVLDKNNEGFAKDFTIALVTGIKIFSLASLCSLRY